MNKFALGAVKPNDQMPKTELNMPAYSFNAVCKTPATPMPDHATASSNENSFGSMRAFATEQGTRMSHLAHHSRPAPRAKKILLVEDNFENRDMLTRRLQRRGFTVCSAPDGISGVAMSVSEKPDLILMDVALGEMDGWQATRLIKSDLRTSNIPIIALTAHALASDRETSVEVGCADFDTKPVDLTRLLGKIESCFTSTLAQAQFYQIGNAARHQQVEGVECDVGN